MPFSKYPISQVDSMFNIREAKRLSKSPKNLHYEKVVLSQAKADYYNINHFS